jgi:hypothetical protein
MKYEKKTWIHYYVVNPLKSALNGVLLGLAYQHYPGSEHVAQGNTMSGNGAGLRTLQPPMSTA